MKLDKVFVIALAAMTMVACKDDENVNTAAGVTVQMQQPTLVFPEDQISSATYYDIPVEVIGDANGPVYVTVEMSPVGENGAKYGENYIVTSTSIVIPAGTKVGNIQFYPNGDRIINPDREFSVKVASAKGATVGNASTTITLMDNDYMIPIVYENIQGPWTVTTESDLTSPDEYMVQLVGYPEGDERYPYEVAVVGWFGMGSLVMTGQLDYNAVTEQALIVFPYGQMLGQISMQGGVFNAGLGEITSDEDGLGWNPDGAAIATGRKDTNDDWVSFRFGGFQYLGAATYTLGANPSFAGSLIAADSSVSMTR